MCCDYIRYANDIQSTPSVDGPDRATAPAVLSAFPPRWRGAFRTINHPVVVATTSSQALVLRWLDQASVECCGSLFALLAAMARGEVASLQALRPHQREPWHAFAVQVAASGLIAASEQVLPKDEDSWQRLLLALTPDWPGGEAWSLVVDDWMRPALLQPPMVGPANRADYRSSIATPDALDMLVTSKNHDLKAARMAGAADEEWFFALLTLQTTEGYLGAGNFGISRMNGGFASRMVLGLRPSGGMSAAWQRDVLRLLQLAATRQDWRRGIILIWLAPWDGTTQLGFGALDQLYIDICRRVRLRRTGHGLEAFAAGSKVARVAAAALKGNTGDPWAPVKADGSASVTPTASGFGFRQFTRLLQLKETTRPDLAIPAASDPDDGMALVAAALVRGQGKTEGLHRRVMPFSRSVFAKLRGEQFLDRVGQVAQGRTDDAGEAGRRLRRALLALVQGGPSRVRLDDTAGSAKIAPWLAGFDRDVDRVFFDDAFWAEVGYEAEAPRRQWRVRLRETTSAVFDRAAEAAPRSDTRRIRARAVARNMLDGSMTRFVEDTDDGA